MHQLSVFVDAAGDLKVFTRGYWILWELYDAYRRCMGMGLQAYLPKIGALPTFLMTTIDAILASNRLRMSSAHMLDTKAVVTAVFDQIWYSANLIINYMFDEENHLSVGHRYFSNERKYGPRGADIEKVVANHGVEFARLTWIIVAPNPTSGTRVTSTYDGPPVSGTLAKDMLLFTLEAVVHSGDAFPPLKSAANGLLFFATCAEMATSNKKQIRSIYKRIDILASCLERGCRTDGSPLSPVHQDAVSTLAKDIAAINEDLGKIALKRKSHFARYLCAKRHRHELRDILVQFEMAQTNYMVGYPSSS
ncbi:hypothetical protein PENSPDRAFT_687262 [Peniophora sp. CONT]|nr:hypothetical protein PENSPDRAFT_687262 [Peniophora sp. CONT]